MSYTVTVTIPAGSVASTLTDFVTRVDLSDMPADWWTDVAADGGNIRVKQGGVVIPFDLTTIAPTLKMGELYFKATLTTGDNAFTVDKSGAALLAVTDPNGRNAVWSDFDLMLLPGLAYTNRTGGISPTVTGSMPPLGPVAQSPALTAHQGVAVDADGNFYAIDTDAIRKYDPNWNLLATRLAANAATGISGVDHLGDGHVYNGELFTTIEKYPNGGSWNNQHVAVWNLADLSFNRSYDISAQAHEASALTRDPATGDWFITDYESTGDSALRRYDSTFAYIGTVTLSAAISNQQGITHHDGFLYIASGDTERIYRCATDGTGVTQVTASDLDSQSTTSTELEGLASDGTNLYVLYDHGTSERVHTFVFNGIDGAHFDLRGYLKATGLSKRTDWTLGVSALIGRDVQTSNMSLLGYGTDNTVSASFANLVMDYDSSGDKYGIWNSTDSWLHTASPVPARYDEHRWHYTHQNTTERKIWCDGTNAAADLGCAQRPGNAGDTLFIGVNNTGAAESYYGRLNRVYLRNGVLSADWITAEYNSWESPSTFYTITDALPVGTLAATLPTLSANLSGTSTPPSVTGSLASTLPVLMFTGTGGSSSAVLTGTLAATLPALSANLSGSVPAPSGVTGSLAGQLPALEALFRGGTTTATTDTFNRTNGRTRSGTGWANLDEPVAAVPATISREPIRVMAQTLPAPTLEKGRPV